MIRKSNQCKTFAGSVNAGDVTSFRQPDVLFYREFDLIPLAPIGRKSDQFGLLKLIPLIRQMIIFQIPVKSGEKSLIPGLAQQALLVIPGKKFLYDLVPFQLRDQQKITGFIRFFVDQFLPFFTRTDLIVLCIEIIAVCLRQLFKEITEFFYSKIQF